SVAAGSFVTPWHFAQLRVPFPAHSSHGRVPRIGLPLQTSHVEWPVAPTPTVTLYPSPLHERHASVRVPLPRHVMQILAGPPPHEGQVPNFVTVSFSVSRCFDSPGVEAWVSERSSAADTRLTSSTVLIGDS